MKARAGAPTWRALVAELGRALERGDYDSKGAALLLRRIRLARKTGRLEPKQLECREYQRGRSAIRALREAWGRATYEQRVEFVREIGA